MGGGGGSLGRFQSRWVCQWIVKSVDWSDGGWEGEWMKGSVGKVG